MSRSSASPALRPLGVGGVHVDRHAVVAAQALGEAHVVGVAVGQHDAAHIVEGAAHCAQLGQELRPETGQAGVDERDALVGVDEVDGDDVGADAAQVGSEFHDGYAS